MRLDFEITRLVTVIGRMRGGRFEVEMVKVDGKPAALLLTEAEDDKLQALAQDVLLNDEP